MFQLLLYFGGACSQSWLEHRTSWDFSFLNFLQEIIEYCLESGYNSFFSHSSQFIFH
jgi:hypothetical protein